MIACWISFESLVKTFIPVVRGEIVLSFGAVKETKCTQSIVDGHKDDRCCSMECFGTERDGIVVLPVTYKSS